MTSPIVISAGQCGYDTGQLSSLVQKAGGTLISTESIDDTKKLCLEKTPALILINRIFDRTGESGLEAIRDLKAMAELSEIPLTKRRQFA